MGWRNASARRVAWAWVCALAACGSPESSAAPQPISSAPTPSVAAPASVVPSAPVAVPASSAPASEMPPASVAPSPPPTVALPAASTLAGALAPSSAAQILAEGAHGPDHYVLYALDAARLARERIAALPDGAARLDAMDERMSDCEDEAQGGWPDAACSLPAVPDAELAAVPLCATVRAIHVARVHEHDGTFQVRADRSLFAFDCGVGTPVRATGPGTEVRVRDLDGDGRDEVTAIFEVAPPDCDDLSSEEGRLAYVLDGASLATQYRASREWYAVTGDVGGSSTSGESVWRLADTDGDGHADLHVRAHGTDATQDDETGDSTSDPFSETADCPYDVAADVWRCPSPGARDYFFGDGALHRRLGEAWVGETAAEVFGAEAMAHVGERLEAALREHASDDEGEDDEGAEDGE